MLGAHEHERSLPEGRAGADATPEALPYRSDLLSSLSAIINRATSPRFQEILAERAGLAIDAAEAFVLRHLGFRGALRPSELAEELATGRSNMSKILRRLEANGLVVREADPVDSRATLVVLTATGRDIAKLTFEIGDDMIHEVTAAWTEDELRLYEGLTARLSADMATYEAKRLRS